MPEGSDGGYAIPDHHVENKESVAKTCQRQLVDVGP